MNRPQNYLNGVVSSTVIINTSDSSSVATYHAVHCRSLPPFDGSQSRRVGRHVPDLQLFFQLQLEERESESHYIHMLDTWSYPLKSKCYGL